MLYKNKRYFFVLTIILLKFTEIKLLTWLKSPIIFLNSVLEIYFPQLYYTCILISTFIQNVLNLMSSLYTLVAWRFKFDKNK